MEIKTTRSGDKQEVDQIYIETDMGTYLILETDEGISVAKHNGISHDIGIFPVNIKKIEII